ncbi:uncharacterized protein N7482_008853 [Penicillium canariense]|uniref:Uncharacterized protein n=1 Tax=Penicillium canariense TaxID=189055 RepID=A0A9W9LIY1_9EURO|nr:uncharacterized protein N7482_008853 [Penicillium canariense]KAJ5157753.1 hypothetical protein N7482_008853 [Penicillium canariense]
MSSSMPENRRNGPTDVSTPFFGTLEAKVAFMLDYAAISPADDSLGERAEELLRVELLWVDHPCEPFCLLAKVPKNGVDTSVGPFRRLSGIELDIESFTDRNKSSSSPNPVRKAWSKSRRKTACGAPNR